MPGHVGVPRVPVRHRNSHLEVAFLFRDTPIPDQGVLFWALLGRPAASDLYIDTHQQQRAARHLLMQGSAGHFYPIHAYIPIMLTPIRWACLTGGRNAYDSFDVLIFIDICVATAYS